MMTKFRKAYEELSIPIGKASVSIGMKPDYWTITSFLTGVISAILFGLNFIWWGLLLMVIMIITDVLDGATARAGDMISPYGGVLDHTVDRYVEIMIVCGLMIGGSISPVMSVFVISGMIMASYVRAAAESIGGIKNCVVGMAGRQEKFLLLFIALILIGFNQGVIAQIPMFLIGLISHITAIQRLVFTIRKSGK